MRCDVPSRTADVRHTDFFVFQRDPRTNRWTCYRAADGFEVGSDSSFEDCVERANVFQAFMDGDLF